MPPEDQPEDPHGECREEINQLRMELVTLHAAIDEMSIGVATKNVKFSVFPPLRMGAFGEDYLEERKQMIIHPTAVHGIMRAIREHALTLRDYGRRAVDAELSWDTHYRHGVLAGMNKIIQVLQELSEDLVPPDLLEVEDFAREVMEAYYERKLND